MFEAGLFGTLEDLFLGAKGGVENFGRGVEDFLNNDTSHFDVDDDDDDDDLPYTDVVTDEKALDFIDQAKLFINIHKNAVGLPVDVGAFISEMFDSERDNTSLDHARSSICHLMRRNDWKGSILTIIKEFYPTAQDAMVINLVYDTMMNSKYPDWKKYIALHLPKQQITNSKVETLSQKPDDLIKYVQFSPELIQVLQDVDSGKVSNQEAAKVISISIDTQKMIWDYLQKKQGMDTVDSVQKTDCSVQALLDEIKKQSKDIKMLVQGALSKAKTTALEEIQCFEEITAFAKKKSEGRLTKTDAEELERKLPVWKQCLSKAKSNVMDTFTTADTRTDSSGEKKPEITLEDFEEALHYVKEQISSL